MRQVSCELSYIRILYFTLKHMLSQRFAPLTGVELKIFIRRLSVDSSEVGLSSACGDGSDHSDWLRTKSRDRGDVMAAISQPPSSSSSSGGGDGVADKEVIYSMLERV